MSKSAQDQEAEGRHKCLLLERMERVTVGALGIVPGDLHIHALMHTFISERWIPVDLVANCCADPCARQ